MPADTGFPFTFLPSQYTYAVLALKFITFSPERVMMLTIEPLGRFPNFKTLPTAVDGLNGFGYTTISPIFIEAGREYALFAGAMMSSYPQVAGLKSTESPEANEDDTVSVKYTEAEAPEFIVPRL